MISSCCAASNRVSSFCISVVMSKILFGSFVHFICGQFNVGDKIDEQKLYLWIKLVMFVKSKILNAFYTQTNIHTREVVTFQLIVHLVKKNRRHFRRKFVCYLGSTDPNFDCDKWHKTWIFLSSLYSSFWKATRKNHERMNDFTRKWPIIGSEMKIKKNSQLDTTNQNFVSKKSRTRYSKKF